MSDREIGIWLDVFSMGVGLLVTERLKIVSRVPPLVCLENKGTHLVYHFPGDEQTALTLGQIVPP